MGFTYYKTMLMIAETTVLSWDDFFEMLKAEFINNPAKIVEKMSDKQIQIRYKTWVFNLYWETQPHVLEESQEIAQIFAKNRPDKDIIGKCHRRITTASNPDPDMEYFNDYVYVLQVFERIPDSYIFDNQAGHVYKSTESPPA
ncbi:MAG: hypothetical protein MUE54_01865 [Anaerolineae bacterium]|jgi:hypothetical protein|nr:hypothetical protein [Anaerolineae bacterium]